MKGWKIAAFVLVVLLLAGCGSTKADQDTSGGTAAGKQGSRGRLDLPTVVIDASGGKKVEVRVEVADDPFEQARGLMHRKSLGEDRGMLFVFPGEEERSFWMRDTLIPLSIAYIDSKGRITDILDMKPLDDKPPHYVSSEPVQYALEVNQGFFEARGVKIGDHARLPK
jgi:uncharacterized protein